MYRYDEFDAAFVASRNAQFANQVARRLDGSLSEDEFRPIRLRNGVYLQLHAYMLRIAIPYGTLSAKQMRVLAQIGAKYDKGYGHFTTRQNIQFNWIKLIDVPQILAELAEVSMHCIQTSGNCIRNVTADHFAGIAKDEIADPRPIAELIRQWSTEHPEFLYLPRKFKIAVTGASADRAVIRAHDIGIQIIDDVKRGIGFRIYAGGGLGRTPVIGKIIKEFVTHEKLLGYLEAVLRTYNSEGRRDNKYKARIKILVNETGLEEFIKQVEAEYAISDTSSVDVDADEIARINAYFALPKLLGRSETKYDAALNDSAFADFAKYNTIPHKIDGYVATTISLKPIGGIPGDATSTQMLAIADLADKYSSGEIRITHHQNIVFPHVAKDDLPELCAALGAMGLATANVGLISDIIACPGLDYCALATARSIPIAQEISKRFESSQKQAEIGNISINISGCINACAHHHIGNIGILGLEKSGRENYQITIGGDATLDMALGERLGPGIDAEDVPDTIERIINRYLHLREEGEEFIDTYRRLGIEHFRVAFANQGQILSEDL
ncbi:MAG: nitrite and sulfite reductase 4Fe-4S region [Hyphomonadaceae bacterium]|nr:MAG: nitrite and sulfite reductase 4Fe-4S region [Hyphomonadaceae bacterium]